MALEVDPGTAALGNPRLIRAIIADIAGSAISFERFMELALYHPEQGYYRKPGRIGPQGDFVTSPSIHPLFGWLVGAWARDLWRRLGEPSTFTIIEPGAGDGRLATSILDWADGQPDGFRDAVRYVAIEPGARGNDSRVDWQANPPATVPRGLVLSNELFDALPVRLFEAGPRGPVEVYVAWDGSRFIEVNGPVASIDGAPLEGRFEVNSRVFATMQSLCGLIESGAVLTFDYGYLREELWAPWRKTGTLLCFYRHTAHEDPYVHVGEQDITAHVDFTELTVAAENADMAVEGPVSQADFLLSCGAGQLVEASRADMAEYFARRRAVEQLTDPGGLGRIRVLAASCGVDGPLPGFEATHE